MAALVGSALLACVLQASGAVQVPPEVLVSVMKVEGGAVGVASKNTNQTEDLGIMQVNTGAWLGTAAKAHFDGNRELAYSRLRDDGCYNILVGAWILRKAIDEEGGDIWEGVGRYHSRTPSLKAGYKARVQRTYQKLFGHPAR
jgi:soluble lytic murein transglycosylase-like protein